MGARRGVYARGFAVGLLVAGSLLVGCGGGGDESSTTAPTASSTTPQVTTTGKEGDGRERRAANPQRPKGDAKSGGASKGGSAQPPSGATTLTPSREAKIRKCTRGAPKLWDLMRTGTAAERQAAQSRLRDLLLKCARSKAY